MALVVLFGAIAILASCGPSGPQEKTFGPPLEKLEEYQPATVEQVFANPELYDKMVVMDVYIDEVCPAGCWFFITDKPGDQVRLYVSRNKDSFTVPESIKGLHAKVYGKVTASNTGEMLEGHRVELID
ncbi:MAG: hypothetical protein GX421_07230 [Caldisericales bacterium]|nr:hypothetical protein [Caldisericales bacterium]